MTSELLQLTVLIEPGYEDSVYEALREAKGVQAFTRSKPVLEAVEPCRDPAPDPRLPTASTLCGAKDPNSTRVCIKQLRHATRDGTRHRYGEPPSVPPANVVARQQEWADLSSAVHTSGIVVRKGGRVWIEGTRGEWRVTRIESNGHRTNLDVIKNGTARTFSLSKVTKSAP